jgi:hypothetical protein
MSAAQVLLLFASPLTNSCRRCSRSHRPSSRRSQRSMPTRPLRLYRPTRTCGTGPGPLPSRAAVRSPQAVPRAPPGTARTRTNHTRACRYPMWQSHELHTAPGCDRAAARGGTSPGRRASQAPARASPRRVAADRESARPTCLCRTAGRWCAHTLCMGRRRSRRLREGTRESGHGCGTDHVPAHGSSQSVSSWLQSCALRASETRQSSRVPCMGRIAGVSSGGVDMVVDPI